jgi:hypothetical protein
MVNNNKVLRIKLSIYMIILMLFVIFSPIFQSTQVYAAGLPELGGLTPKEWYDKVKAETGNGSTIQFEKKSQLLVFVNKAMAASSINVTRFSTIGWQVRFEPIDGSTKYMTWIQPYMMPAYKEGGYVYTPYVVPISPSTNQQYSGSIIESLIEDFNGTVTQDYLSTKFANGVNIYFDAIISIKEPGSTETNAIMYPDRTIGPNPNAPEVRRGEYYLTKTGTSLGANHTVKQGLPKVTWYDTTYGGVVGSRPWYDGEASFKDYFNKPINLIKNDVILQKTVQITHWSTTGERLDPEGKPIIWGLYDIKPGETVPVTVTGMSFPGYKIYSSAFNYTGRGGADDVEVVTGDQAITRTINLTTDHENHYVYFYYQPIEDGGSTPSGSIIFEPNQSADISGNRDNWVNQNIAVKVTVEPSKEKVVMTSSESRSYKYYDSCYTTRRSCHRDSNGERRCTTECVGAWVNSSANCSFKQTWEATELYVTGQGKTAQGSTVSIGPFTIPNGGTITIDKELKDVQLSAKVSEWTPQNDRTFIGGPPPRGSWTQSTPSRDTPAPTEDYESDSGLYYLDKTKPKIDSLSPTSAGWTNNTVNVSIQASDNLSGFYRYNSYAEVIDESYYNRTKPKDYFTQGKLSESKTISLVQDGIYNINVSLEDIAKNQMSKATYGKYKIDKTSPYSASFSWDYRDYIDENLTVTVTVGDNLSGVVETRYVLNNSPYDTSGMHSVSASTADGTIGYDSFTVQITQPGSWWIHVYQRDRAGNVTYTTSEEYKIIRLGTPTNTSGNTFTGQSDKFWISPLQMNHKIPRATRFDTLLQTYGLTETETNYTTVHLTVPNWVDDEIEKKVNGKYAVTDGTTDTHTMEYYSEHNQGPQDFATPSTVLQWWKAYIAPYGTPVTLDKNGNRLRTQYEFKVQLEYDYYYPSKTHISTIKFDIIPETKVKTEIIKNEY